MTKQEFLSMLGEYAHGLPKQDLQGSLEYYSELIDDSIESGMSESEAVEALGSPQDIAHEIMLDIPLPKIIKTKYKKSTPWKVWELIAVILGSPIWISIALAVIAVVITVYAVIWALLASLWAFEAAFAVSAIVCLITAVITLVSAPLNALIYFGALLFATGMSILMFFACIKLTALVLKLSKGIMRFIKRIIIGKEIKR